MQLQGTRLTLSGTRAQSIELMRRTLHIGHRTAEIIAAVAGSMRFIGPIALIVGFTCVFYENVIWGGAHFPYDASTNFYPFFYFARTSFLHGDLGLWNPYVFAGYPATSLSLFGYSPVYWLFSALPGDFTLNRFAQVEVLHISIASIGAFYLARSYTRSTAASLLAALIYGFGGPMASRTQHVATIETASYLPWAILALRIAVRRGSWSIGVGAGILAGYVILAPSAGLFAGYGAVVVFVLDVLWFCGRRIQEVVRRLLLVGVPVVVSAAAISAIRILPSVVFGQNSVYSVVQLSDALHNGITPLAFATALVPNIYGGTVASPWWGAGDVTESFYYFGVPTIVLCVAALLLRPVRWAWVWGGVVVVVAVLATGGATPLYGVAFRVLPGINRFHRPSDATILLCLATAMLAAHGVAAIQLQLPRPTRQTPMVIGLVVAPILAIVVLLVCEHWLVAADRVSAGRLQDLELGLASLGGILAVTGMILILWHLLPQTARFAAFGLVAILAADLLSANRQRVFSPSGSDEAISPSEIGGSSAAITLLKNDLDLQYGQPFRFEPAGIGAAWEDGTVVTGLESVGGYTSALLAHYDAYIDSQSRQVREVRTFRGIVNSYSSPLFSLLNVKYILTAAEQMSWIDPHVNPDDFTEVYDGWPKVFQNRHVLPRAFVVPAAMIARSDADSVNLLEQPGFDPTKMVVLTEPVDRRSLLPLNSTSNSQGSVRPGSGAFILYDSGSKIEVQVRANQPTILFLSKVDYPGWQAEIDGSPVPIWRADYLFEAVPVSAGSHTVTFRFIPLDFRLGLWLFVLAWCIGTVSLLSSLFASPKLRLRFGGSQLPWIAAIMGAVLVAAAILVLTPVLLQRAETPSTRSVMESVANLVDDLPLTAVTQPLGDAPKVSIATYSIGGETKMAILDHPDGSIDWSLPVLPNNSSLQFVTAVAPNCAGVGPGVRFQVSVRDGSTDRVIFDYLESNRASASSESWIRHQVDLSDLSGRTVSLVFRTKPGVNGDYTCAWALWGSPNVVAQHALVVPSDMPFRQMLPGRVANWLLGATRHGG